MKIRVFLSVILSLLFGQFLFGQIVEGEILWGFNRDNQDGLSQNIALAIQEDSCGLIWIGTMDGLNVYDGQEFRDMTRYEKNVINDNDYFDIYLDQDSTIWTRRNQGIFHFSLKQKKWSESPLLSKLKGLVVLPSGKKVAVLDEQELVVMEGVRDYELLPYDCAKETPFVQPILKYDEETGLLYILKRNGELIVYDLQERKCINQIKIGDGAEIVLEDFEISKDYLWALSRTQFFRIDKKSFKVEELTNNFDRIDKFVFRDLYYNKFTENLWLAANSAGVYKFSENKNQWTRHSVKSLSKPQYENDLIITVLESRDGTLYLGTISNAMVIVNKEQIYFKIIPEIVAQDGYLKDLRYPGKMMVGEEGDLWIGTVSQGLWRYKFDENRIFNYSENNPKGFLKSDVIANYSIRNGKIYIAYYSGILGIYDYKTLREIQLFNLKDHSENVNWIVNDMAICPTGSIFIATDKNGLLKITNSKIQQVYENKNSEKKLDNIFKILPYGNKFIMYTFDGQIYEFDTDVDTLKAIHTELPKGSFSIKCLMIDKDQNHWIGTSGQGILLFDQSWNLLKKFNVSNSVLKNNELCNIIQDANGDVWAGTNLGLCYIKNINGRFEDKKLFTSETGLLSSEFITGSHLVQGDTLWMGNIKGVNYWSPDIINEKKSQLPIYITSVLANEKEIYTDIFKSKEITIERNANNLQFRFRTIGFIDRGKMRYRTKLKGYDKKWSKESKAMFVNYNNLGAGRYELQVQARHFDGVWSSRVFRLPFEITKPFFRTNWFYTFLFLLFAFSIYQLSNAISRRRMNRERKTTQFEIELAEMEMQSLRSQINPHFLFNTLSSINNFLLKNEKNVASYYLVKFAKLIRQILQYTRKESILLRDEIETSELYIDIEQMRLGESFDYFVNIEMDDIYDDLIVPPLILQPFIENAIWHGLTHKKGDKILTLTVEIKEERLLIKIEDNGIGRKRANEINNKVQRKSHGIDITKKRLDLWGKRNNISNSGFFKIIDIEDIEVNKTGTIVEIYLPVIVKD